jgi:hypothetical protein
LSENRPSARSLPARIICSELKVSIITSVWPPMTACSCGPEPLYGTLIMSGAPMSSFSCSHIRL